MPKEPINPFRYGKLVQSGNFCSRPEITTLRRHIRAGQNVVLYGERRIGKTSLVRESIRGLRSHQDLLVDIFEVQSIHALSQRIASAIVKAGNQTLLQKFVQAIGSVRPTLTFNQEGAPVIGLDAKKLRTPTQLEPLLDFLCTHYSSPKKVVVFDEFQAILNLPETREIQAIFRSKIQQQKGSFVFLGSIRHEMHLLFTGQDSPFKDSAVLMEVGYLPWDKFRAFLAKKFEHTDYHVNADVWPEIYAITQGHPNETQKLCSALWMAHLAKRRVTSSGIKAGCELIFAMQKSQFERDWASLTDIQQRVLRGVALIGGQNLTSRTFLETSNITHAPTVKRALQKLLGTEILIEGDGEHRFSDPFFRLWLLDVGY